MRARIVDYRLTRGHSGLLILELDEDFRSQYDSLQDTEVDVNIKKWYPSRSKSANAYAWVLINKIAQKVNRGKTEVYRDYVKNYGRTDVICVQEKDVESVVNGFCEGHLGRLVDIADSKIEGCVQLHLRYGSSSYTSQEMYQFLEAIIADCRDLHIETKTREEIDSLMEAWK
jgi:hypothetical protein